MRTYSLWRNPSRYAHKIDDAQMLKWFFTLLAVPILLPVVWFYTLLGVVPYLRRKAWEQAAFFVLLTPVFVMAEAPRYLAIRWKAITA